MSDKKEKSEKTVEPLIQHAQKCAWCGKYLIGFDADFDLYNGTDPLYIGWICHVKCNNPSVVKK